VSAATGYPGSSGEDGAPRELRPTRAIHRIYYALILLLPLVTFIALTVTGRWQATFAMFRQAMTLAPDAVTPEAFSEAYTTAFIWSLSTLPAVLTAWYLGNRHTAARRLNYPILVGFGEIVRLSLGRQQSADRTEDFARPPADEPGIALLHGALTALMLPAFFMAVLPTLRTGPGAVWVGGAGIIMGVMMYCHRRASAYLIDEPGAWDVFRQHRLLNTRRYEERGRPFVRAQITCTVLLPLWWLGGAMFAFAR
jgi:hypothetical protein